MTAEVKYYLNLDDVLAVQLECYACKVRTLVPVAKLNRVPCECPHCKADWVLPDTSAEKAISAFLAALSRAAEALKGQPFKLSLEVNYEQGKAL